MDRRLRRALIGVVVTVGLLVAGDRIALAVAENVAASTIQQSQHLSQAPSVSVGGFPFLTQLASGSYDDIDVVAHGIEVGPTVRQLRIATVSVRLHGVTVTNNFHSVRAERADATATISYGDLSATLASMISYAGAGRIQASAGVTVAGVPIRGTVSALVKISSAGELSFSGTRALLSGTPLPAAVNSVLNAVFGTPISLAGLPFGLHFDGLAASKSGIAIHLTGSNLSYDRA